MAKSKKSLEELEAELAALESELESLESGALPPPVEKAKKSPKKNKEPRPAKAPEAPAAPEAEPEPRAEKPSRFKTLLGRKDDPPAPVESEPEVADAPPEKKSRFGFANRFGKKAAAENHDADEYADPAPDVATEPESPEPEPAPKKSFGLPTFGKERDAIEAENESGSDSEPDPEPMGADDAPEPSSAYHVPEHTPAEPRPPAVELEPFVEQESVAPRVEPNTPNDWRLDGRTWRRPTQSSRETVRRRIGITGDVVEEEHVDVTPVTATTYASPAAEESFTEPEDDDAPASTGIYVFGQGAESDAPAATPVARSAMSAADDADTPPYVEEVEEEEKDRKKRLVAWIFPLAIILLAILVVIALLPTLIGNDDNALFGATVDPPASPLVTFASGGAITDAFVNMGDSATFKTAPVSGVLYTWDFGDGTPSETGERVTHKFAKAGTFTVTVTAKNNGGETATTFPVTVAAALRPAATLASKDVPVTKASFLFPGDAVTFDATTTTGDGPFMFTWTISPDTTLQGPTPTHTFTAAGNYTVTLTAKDAHAREQRLVLGTVTVSPREARTGSVPAPLGADSSSDEVFTVGGSATRVRVNVSYAASSVGGLLGGGGGGDPINVVILDSAGKEIGSAQGSTSGAEVIVSDLSAAAPGEWTARLTRPSGVNNEAKAYTIVLEIAYPARPT